MVQKNDAAIQCHRSWMWIMDRHRTWKSLLMRISGHGRHQDALLWVYLLLCFDFNIIIVLTYFYLLIKTGQFLNVKWIVNGMSGKMVPAQHHVVVEYVPT